MLLLPFSGIFCIFLHWKGEEERENKDELCNNYPLNLFKNYLDVVNECDKYRSEIYHFKFSLKNITMETYEVKLLKLLLSFKFSYSSPP